VFDPTPVGDEYIISFTGPSNATDIQWIDDDTGEVLPPGDDDKNLPLPIPDECEERNISIRYFDPNTGTFRIVPPPVGRVPVFDGGCTPRSRPVAR